MTAASPWSVKGIDPKAREVAKDLARRSGLTLGEWLNQMIIDGEADAPPVEADYRRSGRDLGGSDYRSGAKTEELQRVAQALDQLSSRMEAAENRSTLAISGIDQSVMGVLSRLESVERDQGAVAARFDGALEEVHQLQARTDDRIRRLSEADAPRVEAIKALEGQVGKLAETLYENDGRNATALNGLREDLSNTARRLDRAEAKVEGGFAASSDPQGAASIQAALASLTARLADTETQTSHAVRALEASLAGLDARLISRESHSQSSSDMDLRLERLASELSAKVEASRVEFAERLREAAGGGLDRMESRIVALSAQVEKAEQRSAETLERMGREVMRVATSLGDRVARSEERNTQAVNQVGARMTRLAEAMDHRNAEQDAVHAQALEKLGGEIARIAEKLSERIVNAERRSAQSIDDVGDQLGRVTERLNQRYDRAQSELGDRIRQSEERTAKLLDEAQGKIDARLTESQRRADLEAAAAAARKAAETELSQGGSAVVDDILPSATSFHLPPVEETFTADPFAVAPSRFADETSMFGVEPEEADAFKGLGPSPVAVDEAFVSPLGTFDPPRAEFEPSVDAFAPSIDAFTPPPSAQSTFDAPRAGFPEPAPASAATLSTREMLEQARAAARQASERVDGRLRRSAGDAPPGSVEAPPFEEASKAFRFGLPKRKKKEGVTLRTALVASGTAAALAVTGAGAIMLVNSEMSTATDRSADHFGVAPTAVAQGDGTPAAAASGANAANQTPAPTTASAPPPADQMAVALAPSTSDYAAAGATAAGTSTSAISEAAETQNAAAAANAQALYSSAIRRIEGNDFAGVEDLKRSANLGYAPAQFYLAKLYETAGAGLSKDLTTARRWTERAALGGDVAAMHNLGLYYYEGEGGPQDAAQAAQWFLRAADQGVRDSQYNLALLYAKGLGVPQNPAEAYKWYLIASSEGDAGAKVAARAVRAQLTPETQAAAERSAAAFHAQTQAAVQTALAPARP